MEGRKTFFFFFFFQIYLYTSSSSSDKKSNHFTQFNGMLLRPNVFLQ